MHEAFLNMSFPLFIRINVECTWIIVDRIDRLQALHDKWRKIIRIGHGKVILKES